MVVLETEIKTNESKLSQTRESKSLDCEREGITLIGFMLSMLLAILSISNVCMEQFKLTHSKKRFWERQKEKTQTVDDPMRIKVLDIVPPFLLCFNWSIKEMEKFVVVVVMVDRIKWMENHKSIALYTHIYALIQHKFRKSRFSFFPLLYWSSMKWSRSNTQKSVEKKWKPKVLLAFQSFLEQEIKFTNKNEWTDERQKMGMEFNAHRLVILNSNHIKRIILFSEIFTWFFFSNENWT